ncbi:MAG TPA: hypothetical protein VGP16_20710 [Asanoa sp.]|jgi:hypothetical protein|nr:hypothetical protein [Asanoa sp.]
MPVSPRLAVKIEKDFPADSATIISMLREVEAESFEGDASERLLAAVILAAQGDIDRFIAAVELLTVDWRDLLMASGLELGSWPAVLDEVLGPEDS